MSLIRQPAPQKDAASGRRAARRRRRTCWPTTYDVLPVVGSGALITSTAPHAPGRNAVIDAVNALETALGLSPFGTAAPGGGMPVDLLPAWPNPSAAAVPPIRPAPPPPASLKGASHYVVAHNL